METDGEDVEDLMESFFGGEENYRGEEK